MGLEALSYAYFDQPELVKAHAEQMIVFIYNAFERATSDLNIDFVIIFEDMCYNKGPLISPQTFEEFMTCSGRKRTSVLENVLGHTMSDTITVMNSYQERQTVISPYPNNFE